MRLFLCIWGALVLVPLLTTVVLSFLTVKQYRLVFEPSFATWYSLFETGRWIVVLRTLRIALTLTALELLIAIPFAYWLAKICQSTVVRSVIITMLTIPFFLDASSRVIVWWSLLGTNGSVNSFLLSINLIDEPIKWLLYSEFPVHLVMLASYFPSMVFPIFMIMLLIDDDYIKASNDLGARPLQTFFFVTIPLAMPGILAGVVFALVPMMAALIEPQMLGGGYVNLLGDSVSSAIQQLKYPTAAALSTVIVVLLMICMTLLLWASRKRLDITTMFRAERR